MYGRWLAAFHAVAQSGGFTAAAKVLNIGQPTVSTHVGLLEDHFGVELFHRRGRRVELSPIGKRLLTITEGLFGHEGEAVELLRAARAREIGSLKIGAVRPREALEIGAPLLKRYPNLQLTVTLGATPDILNSLLKFELDVGVISEKINDSRFFTFFYNRYGIRFAVNVDHPLAKRRSIRIEELEGQPVVRRERGSITRDAIDRVLNEAGVKVRYVLETNSREVFRAAILQGIGVGPWSESEILAYPGIKAIPIKNAEMFTQAYVVCLSERRERPLIASFLDQAKECARRIRDAKNERG